MIVLAKNYGQLGNRLVLSAHLIAAAREYDVPFLNPAFFEYAKFFPSTANDLWCRYPVHPIDRDPPSPWQRRSLYQAIYLSSKTMSHLRLTRYPCNLIRLRGEGVYDLADPSFASLARSSRTLLLSGWLFRSCPLLEKHADAVRQHFQIDPEHQQTVDTLIASLRRQADMVVGVHIRHGDYATWENGRYFYSVEQYRAAMQRIADQLGNRSVVFLVCGNGNLDPEQFAGLNVRFGPGHLIEDMYSLAATDLLVGPPSTFTRWASFYGKVPLHVMETADKEFLLDDASFVDGEYEVRRAA